MKGLTLIKNGKIIIKLKGAYFRKSSHLHYLHICQTLSPTLIQLSTIATWYFLVMCILKDSSALTQPPRYVIQSDFGISSLFMFMVFVVHFCRCCHDPNINLVFADVHLEHVLIHPCFDISSTFLKFFDSSCLLVSGLCHEAVLITVIICRAM